MSLHGLRSVTIGVPNVEQTAAHYAEFGVAPEAGGWFSTLDVGRQLRLVSAPTRRLIELRVGADAADDADDLADRGGVSWEFQWRQGSIALELIAAAESIHAAVPDDVVAIVVGSSSSAMHRIVGSAAVSLAHRSPVPVTVVP